MIIHPETPNMNCNCPICNMRRGKTMYEELFCFKCGNLVGYLTGDSPYCAICIECHNKEKHGITPIDKSLENIEQVILGTEEKQNN